MKKLSKNISIISTLLIVITVLFVGCGSKDTAATTKTKTTKATATTTTEKQNGSIDYSHSPENLVEGYSFKNLTAEQQAELIKVENLSYEDFLALPYEEQLKFDYWVFENCKGRADYVINKCNVQTKYNYDAMTGNDFEKAQKYTENKDYLYTMMECLNTYSEAGGLSANIKLQKEFFSLIESTKYCADLRNFSNQCVGNDESNTETRAFYSQVKAWGGGSVVKDDITVELVTKSVSFSGGADQTNNVYQMTFEPVSFVDIHGNNQTVPVCVYNSSYAGSVKIVDLPNKVE